MTNIDVDANRAFLDLLTAEAVRTRTRMIYDAALAGKLEHFSLSRHRLPATAAYVAATIRQNYPSRRVPPHSRWRHLDANGLNWSFRLGNRLSPNPNERVRQRMELAITSVLLDAGAGRDWRWRDAATGRSFARSEGLALASLEAFRVGLFSSDPAKPCQADAAGLALLSTDRLAHIFQASAANPLVGLDERVALLRQLGVAATKFSGPVGSRPRVGHFADAFADERSGTTVTASRLLQLVLQSFGDIWPRRQLGPINLGDTWQHPAVKVDGPTNGLVPFHKLSQWLTYSLIEPLQEAGVTVTELDGLTGLAEYRNGGLFIDMGVIVPRDPNLATTPLTPGEAPIVEWRGLTVALLDEIAPLVRAELGVTAAQMPLASILEGGTWAAGRRIAQEKRPDGGPPLTIVSDGTVF